MILSHISRALILCLGITASYALNADPVAPLAATLAQPDSLESAFADFHAAQGDAEAMIQSHPFYQDPENRAGAQAFIAAITLKAIENDLILDPDYPFFRVLDFRIREGGDNPDQSYFMAPLRGGTRYRIWGRRGTERRLDFQTYAGAPYAPGGGRMAGFLDSEKLVTDKEGRFEVIVSPDPVPGNWLPNPPDGTQVLVRQVFSDWAHERPGDLHIDKIGNEGAQKPAANAADMAARLHAAAQDLRVHIRLWPETVARGLSRLPANTMGQPFDAGPLGGVPGRWMARINFDLEPDEALVIRTWPMPGNYQGIQLADLWYSSLEYTNRQTSLTGDQAALAPDGTYWFVLSSSDPGYANWLDAMGRHRGVALLRFDGMNGRPFYRERFPMATKVKIKDLSTILPAGTPKVSLAQRSAAIALRRRHIQERLGR
ncbi:MAG: hypothetical protein RLZZ136_733 [Pseudomonadota bacterium]|jgi:hypothetical protein